MSTFIDLTGKIFGRLTVLKRIGSSGDKRAIWLCLCKCGNKKEVIGKLLRNSHVRSCGCLFKEGKNNLKHGHKRGKQSKTYTCWCNMVARCTNPKYTQYKDYGGRGITICKQWLKFENFLEDIGEIPKGLTLDRINNNENYSPKNCKLSTMKEQCNNRRNSKKNKNKRI